MVSISASAHLTIGTAHVRADASKATGKDEDEAQLINENASSQEMSESRAANLRKPSGENLGSELDTLLARPSPLDKYR